MAWYNSAVFISILAFFFPIPAQAASSKGYDSSHYRSNQWRLAVEPSSPDPESSFHFEQVYCVNTSSLKIVEKVKSPKSIPFSIATVVLEMLFTSALTLSRRYYQYRWCYQPDHSRSTLEAFSSLFKGQSNPPKGLGLPTDPTPNRLVALKSCWGCENLLSRSGTKNETKHDSLIGRDRANPCQRWQGGLNR